MDACYQTFDPDFTYIQNSNILQQTHNLTTSIYGVAP